MKKFKISIAISAILVIGFILGWWLCDYYCIYKQDPAETRQVRQKSNYKFINPLYECEVNDTEFIKKYIPFEDKIKSRITEEIQKDKSIQLAIYFRNLNNGPWFGINEIADFSPASLLKVPLMMAYFKKAEANPDILDKIFTFDKSRDDYLYSMQQIMPETYLQTGQAYSVAELIRRMIIYSDNEAMALLMNNFSQDDLYQIYSELGVNNPYQDENNVISVKDYASFFRILYNAAYLNQTDSEKSLSLLAQTNFKDGLVAGVPADIPIAHKFGERELNEDEYPEQLHDCGIVYYKKYPYLLCIMTRGQDKNELIDIIKDISRITFEEISRSYPND